MQYFRFFYLQLKLCVNIRRGGVLKKNNTTTIISNNKVNSLSAVGMKIY